MRLSFRTEMRTVIKLLMDKNKWNLKQPKLIISVTGGAKCVLEPRLKETLCKGLAKVATSTQSWVTSGGNDQVRLLPFLKITTPKTNLQIYVHLMF